MPVFPVEPFQFTDQGIGQDIVHIHCDAHCLLDLLPPSDATQLEGENHQHL